MASSHAALRSRALPLAIALTFIAMSSLLTDNVAASQLLALAGPESISVAFALSGVAMAVAALVQFTSLDRRPRLVMLRRLGLGYAVASGVALALLFAGLAPVPLTMLVWLLSDQVQLLLPVLIWSLAGDIFNTSQATRINGWILYWTYGGQALGLAVAALSPRPLGMFGIPLTVVLVVNPLACLVTALWLPRRLGTLPTHRGNPSAPGLADSMAGVRTFLRDVPVWRNIVILSTLAAIAAVTALIAFSASAESVIGPDEGALQTYFGLTMFAVLIGCALWQVVVTPLVNRRLRTASQLMVMPVACIVGGIMLSAGDAMASTVVLALGIGVVGVTQYTVDDGSRSAVLTVIPDSMRARITMVIDLCRFAVAQVVAAAIAMVGAVTGLLWLTGLAVAAVAVMAVVVGWRVAAQWDASLLNWRLNRRKRSGWPDREA